MNKTIVATIVSLAAAFSFSQAQARSIQLEASAALNQFHFEEGTLLAKRDITSGNVTINYYENTIRLMLSPAFHCPPGLMCAQVMPAPIYLQVPVQSVVVGGCNERVYVGMTDRRPVDGGMVSITVTDNSANHCKYLIAIPATEVELETQGPRDSKSQVHTMSGTSLK